MERGAKGALTETLALRALLTTWIMAGLAHNKDRELYIREIEKQSQAEVRALTFANLTPDEIEELRETASMHVSQICASILNSFQQSRDIL